MIATGRSSAWIRLSYPILGAETIGRLGSIMHTIHDCSIDSGRQPFSFTSIGDVDRLGLRFRENPLGSSANESVQEYRRFWIRCLATSLGLLEEAGLRRHALISVRLKRLGSIHRNVARNNMDYWLGQLDDVVGIRVVCERIKSVLEFSQGIRSLDKILPRKGLYPFHSCR